ncbi:lipoprotein-releasing system permease protein [Zymomonas mobilis]|nr:lipoprotein-releasing ABC transporter permease subunit [Zymomonas mobilis]AFN56696.1 lipoprotein releasing system, transmembrane protein, LolC/E family [Zymomonas mobilis subsp. mobilis ATCC 29191]TQK77873.1 lipoprotein-releasing system permease protein [Zymomonas mobilis]TQL15482.1 lipoprotein-releasing system permease protein [Zymomonas mobilis]
MILSAYERIIARRYLLPGKGEAFIFLVASISLLAVTLGVAALIIVMSVMNGFRAELFDKIVGINGHAVIQGYNGELANWRPILEATRKTPGVTSAIPLIEQPLMATHAGRVEGVLLRGMALNDVNNNNLIRSNIREGHLNELKAGSNNVIIGIRLAEQLGIHAGDDISLISPAGQTTPFGTVPRIVSYRVAAIFEVGVYDYDKAFVIMPLSDAQTLLMMNDTVGIIEIKTNNADRVGQILDPLKDRVANVGVLQDWRTMNASLFQALSVERVVMFWILALIILVAAFNILSSLIMLVRAKNRDIAILRTMGASRIAMLKIFMAVGLAIGSLGTLAGVILAFVILYFRQPLVNAIQYFSGQNLWDPSIRIITELPARVDPIEVIGIIALSIGSSFLFTLYPAWKAASTDPVEVLRYE